MTTQKIAGGKRLITILISSFLCQAGIANASTASDNLIALSRYAKLVNPLIGTGGKGEHFPEGNTFPGAVLPWGMASVSPHTHYTSPLQYALGQPAAASGYHADAEKIAGFGLTHLSGVGCAELGAPVVAVTRKKLTPRNYNSRFSHQTAVAGLYGVFLNDVATQVEASATVRTGVLQFTFDGDSDAYILIDAAKNLSWGDHQGHLQFLSDNTLVGWSQTGSFCLQKNKQKIFFAARVSSSIKHGSWQWQGWRVNEKENVRGNVGAWWKVDPHKHQSLFVGISYVSMANALENLERETEKKSFEHIAATALGEWDTQLGKIKVTESNITGNQDKLVTFYTALYHSLLHPNIASDINGDYRAYQSHQIVNEPGFPHYSVFSMWDTYRNVHSLLSLLYPKQQQDMIYSLEDMTLTAGVPPQWELLGSEVNMMVGDPVFSIFAEAHHKGFNFRKTNQLFSILYQSAIEENDYGRRPGNASYRELGYIPQGVDGVWGSVSTTLEYSYHDWALAQLALSLAKEKEYQQLLKQSSGWKNLFDHSSYSFRPKLKNGEWLKNFDLQAINGERWIPGTGGPGYVEGNAYHYQFMLPHQMTELIALHGGKHPFESHLARVFELDQFVLWNEPDMYYPYLFSYIGNIKRTQDHIDALREKYFFNKADGLPGNDDVGALSSWYVFSALGFYPVNPVSGEYQLGLPLFDTVTITLDKDYYAAAPLMIEKRRSGNTSASFNGRTLNSYTITHDELTAGGKLVIEQ